MTQTEAKALSLSQQIETLEPLCRDLLAAQDVNHKLEILDLQDTVRKFLSHSRAIKKFLEDLTPDFELIVKSIIAIGQGPIVFHGMETMENLSEPLSRLLSMLEEVEKFYASIGGILGYHLVVLKLIADKEKAPSKISVYSKPEGLDLSQNTAAVRQAVRWGIEYLKDIAEIYPVGGAGDRLALVDEIGNPLPVAHLPFCGRTLLEGLIRDLQSKEYLHYKLTGKQLNTPIAMMTSLEKDNYQKILDFCLKQNWFGRSRHSFFLFTQPLVPVLTKEGRWLMSAPLKPHLKPGGHGVMWKLALDYGVFDWLASQNRHQALIRQINNPAAGVDHGLLALAGIGSHERKCFGFASCERLLNAAEGMDVLIETKDEKGWEYKITNIEYTEFEQKGISDEPEEPGNPYSIFPANTNVLFADLQKIKPLVQQHPLPGMLINMKTKATYTDFNGIEREVQVGRLESTMQNIADYIVDRYPTKLPKEAMDQMKTFVTYNLRRKTISVTKKALKSGQPMLETPEGCFYELLLNCRDLLVNWCGMEVPKMVSEEEYLKYGPSFLISYHPALGPLYQVISQKIKGGKIGLGAELQLEIAELEVVNLNLNGSLLIYADTVLGNADKNGLLTYSEQAGKCILKNVTVVNKGIDRKASNQYWKNQIYRHEALQILLRGNAELVAEDVVFEGDSVIEVPDGHRLTIYSLNDKLQSHLEKIEKPSWHWCYSFDAEDNLCLKKGD